MTIFIKYFINSKNYILSGILFDPFEYLFTHLLLQCVNFKIKVGVLSIISNRHINVKYAKIKGDKHTYHIMYDLIYKPSALYNQINSKSLFWETYNYNRQTQENIRSYSCTRDQVIYSLATLDYCQRWLVLNPFPTNKHQVIEMHMLHKQCELKFK